MDALVVYLLLVFVLSMVFGAVAQTSRFCPVGGLRDVMSSQGAHRLWSYLVAIAIAVIGVTLIEFFQWVDLTGTKPNYRSAEFAYGRYILGGFIFGFGMVLSAGCGMRNLVRVGQGSLKAVFLVLIMAITAYIMTKTSVYADFFMPIVTPFSVNFSTAMSQDLGSLFLSFTGFSDLATSRLVIALIIALPILYFALKNPQFRQPRYLLSALVIGLVITAGFYITGAEMGQALIEEADFMESPPLGLGTQSYSFAAPMADTVYATLNFSGLSVITFGVVAVIGMPIGAFLSSVIRKEFKTELGFSSRRDVLLSLLGAVLVGIGSVLAMGCSIGHGLTGISTLALGSFLALFSIAVGAFVGIKLEAKL
ncbi:MAG: YeeE/YedE family protein [Pseudomonadota bacterium]